MHMDLPGGDGAELAPELVADLLIAGVGGGVVGIGVQHGGQALVGKLLRHLVDQVLGVMLAAVSRFGVDAAHAAKVIIDVIGAAGHGVAGSVFPEEKRIR